ncbi:MAG: hypothetical protein M3317_16820 [Actinomycetota bacterium]|nr:hypothetical protein [Actinomycetota bacterium]
MPAHYERYLRYVADQPEESIEKFFRVYDLYLKDDSAAYDRMVEERGRMLVGEFGGGGNRNGNGGTPTTGGDEAEDGSEESSSWESWNRFFHELYGPEMLGYDLDEDDYPIDGEADGGVEGG